MVQRFLTTAVVVLLAAHPLFAAGGFDYDFNNLTLRPSGLTPLAGQDHWFSTLADFGGGGSAYVAGQRGGNLVAANSGPGLAAEWHGADARPLDTPLRYSPSDTAATFTMDVFTDNRGGFAAAATGGPIFASSFAPGDNPGPLIFGIQTESSLGMFPHTYLSGIGSGDLLLNTGPVGGDEFQLRLVVDFSASRPVDSIIAAKATLSYRDLTAGQTAFTTDSMLRNVGFLLPTSTASYAYVDVSGTLGASFVDNLHFSAPVPEPRLGLIILSAGIFIAYRRRRFLSA